MKTSIRNFLSSSSSSQQGEGLTNSNNNNTNHPNNMISSTSMRASSASSQGLSQPLPHTIEGTFNYFISVEVRGDKWLQSCNVGVNVFADANKAIPIAAKFKWYRILGESRCYPLAEIAGNTFQCSAQDLCSKIKCDVHPLDAAEDQCKGVASITFGPIDLELSIRETLTSILATATTKFQAQILVNEQIGKQRQAVRCELYISGESMRIVIGEKSLKFRYSLDFPDIRINYLDVNKLLLAFDSNNSDVTTQLYQLLLISQALPLNATQDRIQLPLQMETRTQRDLIYLTHKALATKNYLIDSRIVRNMENSLDTWNEKSQQMFGVSDMLLVVEGLKKELDNMIKSYKSVAADRDKQAKENDRLEMEIKDTIEIYTRMIEQIKESQDETHNINNNNNNNNNNNYNNYNSNKNLGNYSNNILDQSMQQAYSIRDDRGLKSKLKSMEQERLKMTEQLKTLEEENEVLKQIVQSSKETNPSLVKGSWQQREGGAADLKRQLREMENQLREYKLNESFSDQRIFEQKLSTEKNKNASLQLEINRLQEIISQSHFQQNGLIVTGIQQKFGLPIGSSVSSNSLQTSKKPVMSLDPPTPMERLTKELLDCKKELEIAQRELALKGNYQKDDMIIQGLLGSGQQNYSPGKGNNYLQNGNLAEQLAMKEQELIASEFKQEELKRENNKLQLQLLQTQPKQHQSSLGQQNGQNMSFLNESSILLEDAHVLGSTQQDRRAAREREINEYKNKISSLEKKLLQQQSQTQQIGGISFYEETSGLKSENAFLKSKIESLQKELNNKAGDRNQQFEMAALLQNNEKIVKENAELTNLNRKLIDEIDILRNTSKSGYNEVSQVMERGKEMEGLERKLEKMTKLNNALARKMRDMKSKHEQVMDLHNESIASILNPQGEDEKAQLAMLLQTNQRIIEENARLTIENQRLLEEQDLMSKSGVSRQLDVSRHSTRDYKYKLDEKAKEIEQLKKDLEEIKKAKGSGNQMNYQNNQLEDSMAFMLKPLGEYGDYMLDQKKGEDQSKKLEEERRAFEVKRKEFEEQKRENDVMIKQLSVQNNKLLDENARLAMAQRQLAEELEIARNSSFSRMNLSGFNEKSAQVESLQNQLDQQNKMNNQLLQQMKELKSTYDQALLDKKPNANLAASKVEESTAQMKVLMETNRKLIEEIGSLTETNRKLTEELDMQRSMSRTYLDISMNMERLAEAERAMKMLEEQKDVNSKLVNQMREIKVLQEKEGNANAQKTSEQSRKYEEQIKKYEDQVNKLKSRVSELENKSVDDNLFAALQMNLDSKDRVLEQRKIELANQEEHSAQLNKKLREVEQDLMESSRRSKQSEIEIKELNRKIKEYEGKITEQTGQIKEFTKQIKDRDVQIVEQTNQSKNERQHSEQQVMQLQKELRQKEGVELLLEELKQRMMSGQRDQIEGNSLNQQQKQQQSPQIEEMKQANQRLTQQVMALSSQNQQLISEMDDMRLNGMNSSFMSKSYISNTERDRDRERMDQLQEENRILAEELVAISKRQREEIQSQQQAQQGQNIVQQHGQVSLQQNDQAQQAVNVIELQEQVERLLKVNRQLLSENLERGQKNADLREHISELNNSLQNMSFTSDHFIMGIQANNNNRQAQQLMSGNNQIDDDKHLLGSLQQELNSLGNNNNLNKDNKHQAQLDELMRQLESERDEERRLHSKELAKLAETVKEEQRKTIANHKKFEEEERNYNRDNAILKAEIIQLTQSNTVLSNSHKKYEELVSKLKGKVEDLERKQIDQNQVSELKMKIEFKDREIQERQREIEGIELKRKQLQSRVIECEEEIKEWQSKIKETEEEGKDMNRQMKELQGRLEEQIKEIRELKGVVKQKDDRIRERDVDLMELNNKCTNESQIKDEEMVRLSKELKKKEGVEMVLEQLKQRMMESGNKKEEQEESAKLEQKMIEISKANERLTQQIMALSVQNQQLMSEMDEMRLNGLNNSSFMSKSYISNTERDRDRERMDQLQEENRILAEELVAISKRQREEIQAEQQKQLRVELQQVAQLQGFSQQESQEQHGVNVLELQEQIERLLKVNRQLLSENLERGQKNADLREHISELNNSLQNVSMSQDKNNNMGNRASQQIICQNCMMNNGNILDGLEQQQVKEVDNNKNSQNDYGIQLEELRRQVEIEREQEMKVHREEIQKIKDDADEIIKKLNAQKDDLEMQNRQFILENSILKAELIQIQSTQAMQADKEREELKEQIRNYIEQVNGLKNQLAQGLERKQIDDKNIETLQKNLDQKSKDIEQKDELIKKLEEISKKEQNRIGQLDEDVKDQKIKVQQAEEEFTKKLRILVEQLDESVKDQQALKEEINEKEQRNAEKEALNIEQQIRFKQEIEFKDKEFAKIQLELQSKEIIQIAYEQLKIQIENHQKEAQEIGEQQQQQQQEFQELQKANQRFTEQIMSLSSQNQQLMSEIDELRLNGLNNSNSMSRSYISVTDRDRDRERMEQIQEENRILAEQLIAISRKQRDDIAIQQVIENNQVQEDQNCQLQEQVKVEDLQVQIERLLEVNRQLLCQNQENNRKQHNVDIRDNNNEFNRSLQNMQISSEIFVLGISQTKEKDNRQPKELMGENNNNIPDFENVLDSLHEVVQQSSIPQLEAIIKQLESDKVEVNERHINEIKDLKELQDQEQKRLKEEHTEIEKDLNNKIDGFKEEIEMITKDIEQKNLEVIELKKLQEQNETDQKLKDDENQQLNRKIVEIKQELEKMNENTETKRQEYDIQIIALKSENESEIEQSQQALSKNLEEIDSLKRLIINIQEQSSTYLEDNIQQHTQKIDSLSKTIDDLTLNLSVKTKEFENVKELNESMEKKIESLQKDIIEKGQRFQQEVGQLSEKLEEAELAGEEYQADKENELKQFEESKLNLKKEIDLLKGQINKGDEEKKIQEEQMDRMEKEKKELAEEIVELKEKYNTLKEEKQTLEDIKMKLEIQIKEGQEKQVAAYEKIKELNDIKDNLEKKLEDINGKNGKAQQDIENMQKQNDILAEEISNLKEQINNYIQENDELKGINNQLTGKNSKIIESHEELKKSHVDINQSKEMTEKENEQLKRTLEDLNRNIEQSKISQDEQQQFIEQLESQIEGKKQELKEYIDKVEKQFNEKQIELMGQLESVQKEKDILEETLKEKTSLLENNAQTIQDLLKKIDDVRIGYQRDLEGNQAKLTDQFTEQTNILQEKHKEELQIKEQEILQTQAEEQQENISLLQSKAQSQLETQIKAMQETHKDQINQLEEQHENLVKQLEESHLVKIKEIQEANQASSDIASQQYTEQINASKDQLDQTKNALENITCLFVESEESKGTLEDSVNQLTQTNRAIMVELQKIQEEKKLKEEELVEQTQRFLSYQENKDQEIKELKLELEGQIEIKKEEYEKDINQLNSKVRDLEEQLLQQTNLNTQLSENNNKQTQDISQTHAEKINAKETQIQELSQKLEVLKDNIKEFEGNNKLQEKIILEKDQKLVELQDIIAQLESKLTEKEKNLTNISEDMKQQKIAFFEAGQSLQLLKIECEDLQKEKQTIIQNKNQDISEYQTIIAQNESIIADNELIIAELNQELENRKDQYAIKETKITQRIKELEGLLEETESVRDKQIKIGEQQSQHIEVLVKQNKIKGSQLEEAERQLVDYEKQIELVKDQLVNREIQIEKIKQEFNEEREKIKDELTKVKGERQEILDRLGKQEQENIAKIGNLESQINIQKGQLEEKIEFIRGKEKEIMELLGVIEIFNSKEAKDKGEIGQGNIQSGNDDNNNSNGLAVVAGQNQNTLSTQCLPSSFDGGQLQSQEIDELDEKDKKKSSDLEGEVDEDEELKEYMMLISKQNADLERIMNLNEELKTQLGIVHQERIQMNSEIERLKEDSKVITQEYEEKLNEKIQEIQRITENYGKENQKMVDKIKELEESIEKLKDQRIEDSKVEESRITQMTKDNEQLQSTINQISQEKAIYLQQFQMLQTSKENECLKQIADVQQLYLTMKQSYDEIVTEQKDAEEEKKRISEQLEQLKVDKDSLIQEKSDLKNRIVEIEGAFEGFKNKEFSELQDKNKELLEKIKEIQKISQNGNTKLIEENGQMNEEKIKLAKEIESLHEDIVALKGENKKYKDEREEEVMRIKQDSGRQFDEAKEKLEKEILLLKGEIEASLESIGKLKEENQKLQGQIRTMEQEHIKIVEENKQNLEKLRNDSVNEKNALIKEQKESYEQKLRDFERSQDELKVENQKQQQEQKQIFEVEKTQLIAEKTKVSEQLSGLLAEKQRQTEEFQVKIDELLKEKTNLEEQLNNLKQIQDTQAKEMLQAQQLQLAAATVSLISEEINHNSKNEADADAEENRKQIEILQDRVKELESELSLRERSIQQLSTQNANLVSQTFELQGEIAKLHEEIELNRSSYSQNSSFVQDDPEEGDANNND